MYHKYTGIILKKHPLGDADELLTIYTKEAGKLRVKAVGSRKIKSRLAGALQSLNEIEFETASARSRGKAGLPVLISVRARAVNNYLRENLKKFAYALVGVETLYRLTPDTLENAAAYQALGEFLQRLRESGDEKFEVRALQLRLLETSGFRLPADRCLNCRRALPPRQNQLTYFVSGKGGFFCPDCRSGEQADVSLTPAMLNELQDLSRPRVAPAPDLGRETELVIDGFLNYVLEREIKANGFVKTLNQEAQI